MQRSSAPSSSPGARRAAVMRACLGEVDTRKVEPSFSATEHDQHRKTRALRLTDDIVRTTFTEEVALSRTASNWLESLVLHCSVRLNLTLRYHVDRRRRRLWGDGCLGGRCSARWRPTGVGATGGDGALGPWWRVCA